MTNQQNWLQSNEVSYMWVSVLLTLAWNVLSCSERDSFFPEDNQMCFPKMCIQVLSSSSVLWVLYEAERKWREFSFSHSEIAEQWSWAGDVICLQQLPSVSVSVLSPHCYTWIPLLPEHTALRAPGPACGCHKLGTVMLCWFILPQELLWSAGILPQ